MNSVPLFKEQFEIAEIFNFSEPCMCSSVLLFTESLIYENLAINQAGI